MLKKIIIAIILLSSSFGSYASELITNISTYEIIKTPQFHGVPIAVSGITDDNELSVIVVISGPKHTYKIWKKSQIFGVWHNKKSFEIKEVPSFYYIASNVDIDKHFTEEQRKEIGGGLSVLTTEQVVNIPKKFVDAFVESQKDKYLYPSQVITLTQDTANMFRQNICIPKAAKTGVYNVFVYRLVGGKLTKNKEFQFTLKQSELDTYIADIANNRPLFYSFVAIAVALLLGAIVSYLFRSRQQNL